MWIVYFVFFVVFVVGLIFWIVSDDTSVGIPCLLFIGMIVCWFGMTVQPYITQDQAKLQFMQISTNTNIQVEKDPNSYSTFKVTVDGKEMIGLCTAGDSPKCTLAIPWTPQPR